MLHSKRLGTGMKRHFQTTKLARKAGAVLAAAATFVAVATDSTPAAAQEIQLTGPLAGAPSVRKLRLYREGRFEIAPGIAYTLLSEYQRTLFVTARLQYNVFDWLGVGVFGGFGVFNDPTDLSNRIQDTAPRNTRTAANLPGAGGQKFQEQLGKLTYMAAPQVTFSPFRGKLAVFQKLFIDTDLYIHAGVAFVGVQERKDCTACTLPASFATESRTAIAPTFGLGLSLYASGLVSVALEYRAFPFIGGWNRGGFDSRGSGPDNSFPDNKIDKEDRTFQFNQTIGFNVGFSFPKPQLSE